MSTGTVTPATYSDAASLATFSVARYQRMIESGALTADDRVELLENYVVPKTPRSPPHDGTIELLDEILRPFIPVGWRLRVQLSVVLSDSQPEPDFAIVRGKRGDFAARHPTLASSSKLPIPPFSATNGTRPGSMPGLASRCTGSSTSWTGGSKSTPSRRGRRPPRPTVRFGRTRRGTKCRSS
jgi:hypothetical protein